MKKFPQKLAQNILKSAIEFLEEKKVFSANQKISINLAEVSEDEIQRLNGEYRGKKESTDILSFSYNLDKNEVEGDLILCWSIIEKNSQEDGISPKQELAKNLVHGCLHLAGYKHSVEMFSLQKKFLKENELQ
jgi:probable rRNA maturation factor